MAGKAQIQIIGGTKVVTEGLVFYADVANYRSYTSGSDKWNSLGDNTIIGTLSGSSLPIYDSANQGTLQFTSSQYQKASFNTPNQLKTGGEISVAIWAKWITNPETASIGTIQALIDNDHSGGLRGFILQDRPDLNRTLQFGVLNNYNGVRTTGNTSGVVNGVVGDGTWKYIVGTNDLINDKIYINGVLNNTGTDVGGISSLQPNITVGAIEGTLTGGVARFINGNIAMVKIYNRALSANEILQNYNALKGRFEL